MSRLWGSNLVLEPQIEPMKQHFLHGFLDICLDLLHPIPLPIVQERDTAQVFETQDKGAHAMVKLPQEAQLHTFTCRARGEKGVAHFEIGLRWVAI